MKALVANSGGIDSTTCVAWAVELYGKDNVSTVSLYYGQKHDKELKCAQDIADHYGVKHYELDISNIMQFSNSPLLKQSTEEILDMSYTEQIKEFGEGEVHTYVPNRNMLIMAILGTLAQSIYKDEEVDIIHGMQTGDQTGNTYPDCSKEFFESCNQTLEIANSNKVHLKAPFVTIDKAGVVKYGLEHTVPYEKTWSCYRGGEKACGHCGTCIDRLAAFKANGVEDPIDYEDRTQVDRA